MAFYMYEMLKMPAVEDGRNLRVFLKLLSYFPGKAHLEAHSFLKNFAKRMGRLSGTNVHLGEFFPTKVTDGTGREIRDLGDLAEGSPVFVEGMLSTDAPDATDTVLQVMGKLFENGTVFMWSDIFQEGYAITQSSRRADIMEAVRYAQEGRASATSEVVRFVVDFVKEVLIPAEILFDAVCFVDSPGKLTRAIAQEISKVYGDIPVVEAIERNMNVGQKPPSSWRESWDLAKKTIAPIKEASEDLADKRVILVDDVVLWGGTLFEAYVDLKLLGAKEIVPMAVIKAGVEDCPRK